MVALNWDQVGERFYETGVDRGVFYPSTGSGVVWNGLISVTEAVSGGDANPIYFDGKKVLDLIASEDYQATVEAYSAPAEFRAYNGVGMLAPGLFVTQQPRMPFGFSYRTLMGNDILRNDYGYKIHIVYNVTASPAARSYKSLSKTTDVDTLSWTFDAVPPTATTFKPSAHLVINSTLVTAAKLTALENLLYGTASTTSALPTQAAVIALLAGP